MKLQHVMAVITLVFACCWGATVSAQETVRIDTLSRIDIDYMAQQRQTLQDLASVKLGRSFTGNRNEDLATLQALLDKGLVRPGQTQELQGMGIIMGDLLAAELGMHWVIYEDKQGRSRALRYRETDNYLFPVTMISRRREVGNETPVTDIYQKAYDSIAALIPPLPFQ